MDDFDNDKNSKTDSEFVEELSYSSQGPQSSQDRKEYAKKQRRKAYLKAKEFKKKLSDERKLIPPTESEIEYKNLIKERAREARRKSYLFAKELKKSSSKAKFADQPTPTQEKRLSDHEELEGISAPIPPPFEKIRQELEGSPLTSEEVIETIGRDKLRLLTTDEKDSRFSRTEKSPPKLSIIRNDN